MNLFEKFLEEKKYLTGVTAKTISTYRSAWIAYERVVGDSLPDNRKLKDFVIGLQKSGVTVCTINCYARSFNSYLTWLYKEGYVSEPLRLALLREQRRVFKALTDQQLRAILSFKPRTFGERRFHTLLCLALDTGCRIDELLTIQRTNVDMDNLLIKVYGKGGKERVIPISAECRKVLYKFIQRHSFDLCFCTRHGGKLRYDNLRRDWVQLMTKLGIETDGAFHSLRRTFATNFTREGGNLFALQRMLGHASIQTTQRYVGLSTEDLRVSHAKTSLLTRLRV